MRRTRKPRLVLLELLVTSTDFKILSHLMFRTVVES